MFARISKGNDGEAPEKSDKTLGDKQELESAVDDETDANDSPEKINEDNAEDYMEKPQGADVRDESKAEQTVDENQTEDISNEGLFDTFLQSMHVTMYFFIRTGAIS